MKIGIGTYSLFWEFSSRNPEPLSIIGMLDRAAQLGCDVFQICDDPRIDDCDAEALHELREHAEELGLELELGTRSIDPAHLRTWIEIAVALGARTLRSMVQSTEVADGLDAAVSTLRDLVPVLEAAGITLALETYEQIPTADLLDLVTSVGSPSVGICLDPANCVSALEHPRDVIGSCAALTVNLHVKDFAFARQEGWVGFTYSGAPLGDGLLDLEHELGAVYADGRAPSAIVEHWLPWQGDLATTLATERAWTDHTLAALRTWRAQHLPSAA